MTAAPTLAALSRGRDNNLTLLRLVAATAVVYGHAFGITGRTAIEPFFRMFGLGTADVGVDAFFIISGFLVAKSLAGKDLVHFAWARIMRIFPALWISSVMLVLTVGLLFSPLPAFEFWLRHDTVTYVLKNATMLPGIGSQPGLPFAFKAGSDGFNTSLWTLPHELQMYLLLAVLGVCGALRRPWVVACIALVGGAAFSGDVLGIFHLGGIDRARFVFLFFSGTVFYLLREHIPMDGRLFALCFAACVAGAIATRNHDIHELLLVAMLPYMTIWLSFVPAGAIRRFNDVGDYSYGTYILAGPVQEFLTYRIDKCPPLLNFGLTMLIVIPAAAASWHLLESRALAIPLPAPLRRLSALVPGLSQDWYRPRNSRPRAR